MCIDNRRQSLFEPFDEEAQLRARFAAVANVVRAANQVCALG
jgi:hypothetical protein